MRTRQCDDPYEDGFGLGWDEVSFDAYDKAGVQILSKGGDLINQHAELLVAPDEKISIGVVSAGGSSSYNTLLAMALMDIALEEKGISISRSKPESSELIGSIPEKYLKYEGLYMNSDEIYQLTFPQKKYMNIKHIRNNTQPDENFMYTSDDSFVKVVGKPDGGNVSQSSESMIVHFAERKGNIYLTKGSVSGDDTFGFINYPECYTLQKLEENPVSENIQAAWDARNNKRYYICNEIASSVAYSCSPAIKINIAEGVKGYVDTHMIKDSTHAESVIHIPSTLSRDETDMEIITEKGTEYLLMESSGIKMISEDAIPDMTGDIREVKLTSGAASWYNTERKTITLDMPENAAFYVYDSHDRLICSSLMKNIGKTVVLPPSGKIVFIGETGSTVGIQQ